MIGAGEVQRTARELGGQSLALERRWHFGVLQHDAAIAQVTALVGWIGMLATCGWLIYRWRNPAAVSRAHAAA